MLNGKKLLSCVLMAIMTVSFLSGLSFPMSNNVAMAAVGETLYSEDFNDGVADNWNGLTGVWSINSDDGSYNQTQTGATKSQALYNVATGWTNFELCTDVTTPSAAADSGAASGVLFRCSTLDGRNSYGFRFLYDTDGIKKVEFCKWKSNSFASIQKWPFESTPGETYRIKVWAQDFKFKFFINDIPITEDYIIDINSSHASGTIGLYTFKDSIKFDNVIVKEMGPAPDDPQPEEDIIAPVTSSSYEGSLIGSLFTSDVAVSLSAVDSNSGVNETKYSLDGGANWLDYSLPFTIANEGENLVLYYSTDNAGNVEEANTLIIPINKTGTVLIDQDLGAVKAFPDAEGFGTDTIAGRGGNVIKVTNLNDRGPGSLREAIDATGPRTIVFEVAGEIVLGNDLSIDNPYVTIAGQTAPSPGITIKKGTLNCETHDILIQHLRIRPGDEEGGTKVSVRDGLRIENGAYNVVVDHCSISWANDENVCIKDRANNITLSNSIISEGFQYSQNAQGSHSKGTLISYGADNVSTVKNLNAHNDDRSPAVSKGSSALSLNEMYYNFGYAAFTCSNTAEYTFYGPNLYTSVGDVYIAGPDSTTNYIFYIHPSMGAIQPDQVYLADTIYTESIPYLNIVAHPEVMVNAPTLWDDSLIVMPASSVEQYLYSNAGARPADRDAVDMRIINEAQTRTGSIIDSQNEVGGYPVLPETHRFFNVDNPNGDDNGNGYTNIEEVLYLMALDVEGRTLPTTNMRKLNAAKAAASAKFEINYSAASWAVLTAAYALPETSDGEIVAKTTAINNAINTLVFTDSAEDLEAAKAAAAAKSEANYSAASWAVLTAALAMPETTNADVVSKTVAINNAMTALVPSIAFIKDEIDRYIVSDDLDRIYGNTLKVFLNNAERIYENGHGKAAIVLINNFVKSIEKTREIDEKLENKLPKSEPTISEQAAESLISYAEAVKTEWSE